MNLRLNITPTQRQVLAPSMQQSIEILLLPIGELSLSIDEELQNNPLLEIEERDDAENSADIDESLRQRIEYLLPTHRSQLLDLGSPSDDIAEDKTLSRSETLEDLLLRQLYIEFTDPVDIKIGEFIIGNLNEDGYLPMSCQQIANAVGVANVSQVKHVLDIIHHFEPLGIAAQDLRECLLIQIRERTNGADNLVGKIIDKYLPELGQRKYAEIARRLGIPLENVKRAVQVISTLEPRPARNYRPAHPTMYIKPDVVVVQGEDQEFHIQVSDHGIPRLRLTRLYKNLLNQRKLAAHEKEFIREKTKNALQFIRSIEQRGQTIKEITKFILKQQKDFFQKGSSFLVPMKLSDVAAAINRNESTVSRAINNKYIDTPQGLFPLKYFFSQAVGENVYEKNDPAARKVSNRSVKEEIRELIENENTNSPLSDQKIQAYFETKGTKIARRTISKYRQALNILPSHLRKN